MVGKENMSKLCRIEQEGRIGENLLILYHYNGILGKHMDDLLLPKLRSLHLKACLQRCLSIGDIINLKKYFLGRKDRNQTIWEVPEIHITSPKLDQAHAKTFTFAGTPGNKLQTEDICYTEDERKQNDLNQPVKNPYILPAKDLCTLPFHHKLHQHLILCKLSGKGDCQQ